MSVTAFHKLLNDEDITQENEASEFYHCLVKADIMKYINPAHDKIDMENYFHSALNAYGSAKREEGFRRGLILGFELFRNPTFNEFTAEAIYNALTLSSVEGGAL